jgi:hypothetical protein
MSHFSKIKTQITDKELLETALQQMGCMILPGKHSILGFREEQTPVDLCVSLPKETYEIGFTLTNDKYELAADWWGIQTTDQKTFLNALLQKYAYLSTVKALEKQGFRIASEETTGKGEIKLVLRRMA